MTDSSSVRSSSVIFTHLLLHEPQSEVKHLQLQDTNPMLNDGVTERAEVKPGAGEETFDERGPVLHPFEPGLDQDGELGEVAFGQVGQGPFQVRPHLLDWVELVRIRW